jgi:ElaB/YqjD/DUF883 family membrane-anchored ribosome-binding protein
MKNGLLLVGIALSILVSASVTNNVVAQNLTTNASNAAGNMSRSANQTASEMGQNVSNTIGNASQSANQTMSEQGKNASSTLNKTRESANATMSEVGKNVTDAGKTVLNKTAEVAKGVGSGAASVLGNITGEIKEGISSK